jgi:hypothetical protein
MANDHHLNLLETNAEHWNEWRRQNPGIIPDLYGAQLEGGDISGFNLRGADLVSGNLRKVEGAEANLAGANCQDADFSGANFRGATFALANLSNCNLARTNFHKANLEGAILAGANIFMTIFRESRFSVTVLTDLDLETAVGLTEVVHGAPSSIGTDTLFRSNGNIPETFLRACGVPAELIAYLPSLAQAAQAVQFHSCFISYSHEDELFARQLWSRMRNKRIRVWYAPEEMRGGQKLFDQIDRAIQLHDKLLLVLSKASMKSNWVVTEIRKARARERQERRRKLFPIRLVDFDTIRNWECFDADTGMDIAAEIREYFVPDFSKWMPDPKVKDRDKAIRSAEAEFDVAFERLCRDLKAEGVGMP